MLKKITIAIIAFCLTWFNASQAKTSKDAINAVTQISASIAANVNIQTSANQVPQDLATPKPKSIQQDKPFNLSLAYEYSNLDYSMLTTADSVLKWRDSRGKGIAISFIEKNKDEKTQSLLRVNLKYTSLSGGQMSDYDIKNTYSLNKPGIFSETESITGNYLKLQILDIVPIEAYKNSVISFISGFELQNLNLDPVGIYQIVQQQSNVRYSSGDFQNVKMKTFGLNLGLRYKLDTSNDGNYFALQVQTFLPYYFSSKQYNWGYNLDGDYDWKLESRGFSTMKNSRSISLRAESVQKINNDISLNLYAFAESFKFKNLDEIDRKAGIVEYVGKTKYAQISNIGLGLGLIL